MRRRAVALGLPIASLVAVGCGASPAPPGVVTLDAPRAPAPPTAAALRTSPTLLWRRDLPEGVEAQWVAASAEGTVAVALRFEGGLELEGASLPWRGGGDVALALFDAEGRPKGAVGLGGPGEDEVECVAATPEGFAVAVRSDAALEEVGVVVRPGPGQTGAGLLVLVDGSGRITGAGALPPASRNVRLAPAGGGELYVGWTAEDPDSLFGGAHVARRRADGTLAWSQATAGRALYDLTEGAHGLVASLRGQDELEAERLDGRTGARIERVVVEKLPSAGDLGALSALEHEGRLVAFGETGGPVRAAGAEHPRPPYALQPFLVEPGPRERFVDLAQVTAWVVAVGAPGGAPAALVDVIHTGPRPDPPRGVYVVRATEPLQWIALSQYAYEGDDWESGARIDLLGVALRPRHGAFVAGGVVVLGRAGVDRPPGRATLLRYALPER